MSKLQGMKFKRVLAYSDSHCGHCVGLCPPGYRWQYPKTKEADPGRWKACKAQRELHKWFVNEVDELREDHPLDICFANGDMIDGRGERSSGTELVTTDLTTQGDMALWYLSFIKAKKYVMTYGTPYHTGEAEDQERIIAQKLRTKDWVESVRIGSHEWPEIYGVVFDMKHHISTSQIPHGRFTAISKDKLWNSLWSIKGLQPDASIVIRSHAHYNIYAGTPDWFGLVLPSMQAMGTRFGTRKCSGLVNIGFVHFDVYEDGSWLWQPHIADLKCNIATTTVLD